MKRAARGSLKIRDAKNPPKFASAHHRTTLSGYMFANKAHIDNRKKLVKCQYLPHTSSQYGELWSTAAEIGSLGWDTPANFNVFRVLASLLQRRRSTESNQTARCLAVSWAATLHIHFRGLFPRNGILPGAKFTLRPSFAHYIGSVTARHASSGRQPNFAALSRGRRLYSVGRPSRWALSHIL